MIEEGRIWEGIWRCRLNWSLGFGRSLDARSSYSANSIALSDITTLSLLPTFSISLCISVFLTSINSITFPPSTL